MTDITGSGIPTEEAADPQDGRMPERGGQSPIDLSDLNDQELLLVVDEALDRLSFEELASVIEMAQERRSEKQEDARRQLLEEFRERAMQMGFPLEALFPGGGRRRRSDAGSTLPVRYRGPNGEPWSGRGRKPQWLIALENAGHTKEEYLVAEG